MIALARAGPMPGNLSSSWVEAEFMSTNPSAGCGRAVAVAAVCAATGPARSRLNPRAANRRINRCIATSRRIGRAPFDVVVERDDGARQAGPFEAAEHR